jgi:hypothetical protein
MEDGPDAPVGKDHEVEKSREQASAPKRVETTKRRCRRTRTLAVRETLIAS